jgi:hypothetical protein
MLGTCAVQAALAAIGFWIAGVACHIRWFWEWEPSSCRSCPEARRSSGCPGPSG